MIAEYLETMRATAIPEGWAGLWRVRKQTFDKHVFGMRASKPVCLLPGTYTYLRVLTDSTLLSGGELVMEDTPFELKTHLGMVLRAHGRVLVTGLGLGCVVRGLLHNPRVEHVTVIENSPDVLKLVAPHMPAERLTIVEAEALEWTCKNKERFDCAWHDLWTNTDNGEPHLDIWHAQLIANCERTVREQGAWAFNKILRRMLQKKGFRWIG